MSFILDALKKSERERQKQAAPALFEVKVAPPRNRFPVWAVIIGVLLVVNIGVVVWLVTRNGSKSAEASEVTAANTAPSSATAQRPRSQTAFPPTSTSLSGGAEYFGDPQGIRSSEPTATTDAANEDAEEPTSRDGPPEEGVINPEDFEPAVEPGATAAKSARTAQAPAEESPNPKSSNSANGGLPSYQDAVAMPGMNLPPLRLDLHVYDPQPDKRFVFVNMQKLKQGDSAQGVRIDTITPDGAVMSYRGVRFLLHRE